MGYFYFKPPENYEEHIFLISLFKPYSIKGKLLWWFWKNLAGFRNMFFLADIEKFIPEALIRKSLSGTPTLSFNFGSRGPERKITALGIENGEKFVIKFAQSPLARLNVINESNVLKQLHHLDFVPRLLEILSNSDFVLLKTTVFLGERYTSLKLSNAIISRLLELNNININNEENYNGIWYSGFAHGDFCPWNIIIYNEKVLIYDWELAGIYPLGYDLFTFIFQPALLLNHKPSLTRLLSENIHFIETYFDALEITYWRPYLILFAERKLKIETNKMNYILINGYKELLDYAKKA